jgi:hypothetical protein
MTLSNDRIILDQILEQRQQMLAPDLTAHEYFEIFSAEQILKDYALSYDEIRSGIVGQGGDGGIDSMYTLINEELLQEDSDPGIYKKIIDFRVVIIQSKTSGSFAEDPIDKLTATTEDLFDLSKNLKDLSQVYNKEVISAAERFRNAFKVTASKFPDLTFCYYYASKGADPNPNVQRKVERLRRAISQLFSSAEFNFEFLGAKELLALARRVPKTSHTLNLAENPISSTGEVGFICLVRLRDYYNFITDDEGNILRDIFEANVRDYQGVNEINEQIQETLRSAQQEDFWWLNNGSTIIASKATQSGKALTIENPEIVNGLQTSTEIYNYFKEARNLEDNRTILVRVIVPDKQESRDRVIKATNSQTPISPASLRATDKIHRDIEEYFKPYSLYYDRRKNYHKNDGKPIDRIIGIPMVAQAVMAIVLQRPDDARGRPSSLIKEDTDYKSIFNPKYPIGTFYFCTALMRYVEEKLKTEFTDRKDRNNTKYHVAMYIAALLAGKARPSAEDIAKLSVSDISDAIFSTAMTQVRTLYEILGPNDRVAKGPQFLEEVKIDIAEQIARRQTILLHHHS